MMTKLNWTKIICVFLLLAFIVLACVIEDRIVVSSLQEVKNYCYEIEKTVESEGKIVSGEVASLVSNLDYVWHQSERHLCLLVNHKNIEQLEVEVVKLKSYISEDEKIEFMTSLQIIKNYVEAFQHFMGASFHNLL